MGEAEARRLCVCCVNRPFGSEPSGDNPAPVEMTAAASYRGTPGFCGISDTTALPG